MDQAFLLGRRFFDAEADLYFGLPLLDDDFLPYAFPPDDLFLLP